MPGLPPSRPPRRRSHRASLLDASVAAASAAASAPEGGATTAATPPAQHLFTPHPCPTAAAGPSPRFISKWVSLSAGLIVALCSGLTYLFPLYAPALRAEFGWDQKAIAGIGTAANLGGYASLPSGLMFDALSGRHPRAGPRATIVVGCILMASGWGWLSRAAAAGPPAPYAAVAAAAALGGFGAAFLDTAALALAVANHPSHRGTAVGVTKAGLGLSGACWATAWTAAAGSGSAGATPIASLLKGLAILPPLVALVACAGVNLVPFTQADEAAAAAAERAARHRVRAGRSSHRPTTPPPPPYRRPPALPAARFATAGHAILAIAAYETAAALALRGGSGASPSPPPRPRRPGPAGGGLGGPHRDACGRALRPGGRLVGGPVGGRARPALGLRGRRRRR